MRTVNLIDKPSNRSAVLRPTTPQSEAPFAKSAPVTEVRHGMASIAKQRSRPARPSLGWYARSRSRRGNPENRQRRYPSATRPLSRAHAAREPHCGPFLLGFPRSPPGGSRALGSCSRVGLSLCATAECYGAAEAADFFSLSNRSSSRVECSVLF